MANPNDDSAAQSVCLSKFFDTKSGEQPLARAREWASSHSTQGTSMLLTPMIVVAEEQQYGRRFLAATVDALWQFVRFFPSDRARHLHEVVPADAPCRLYCDLEYEFGVNEKRDSELKHRTLSSSRAALREAIERNARGLIEALVRAARDEYSVTLEPFVSTSHKPSKWSMHVVFGGAAWRSARHCGAFVAHVARMRRQFDPCVDHYVDSGVYDANHCLRMYRCSKRAEPGRSVLAEDEADGAPLDRVRWQRSLITYFALAPPGVERADAVREGHLLEFTSLFLAEYFDEFAGAAAGDTRLRVLEHADATLQEQHRNRGIAASVRAQGASRDAAASCSTTALDSDPEQLGALRQLRPALEQLFAEHKPRAFKLLDGRPWMRVDCRSHHCGVLRGEHRSNTIFFMVDYARKRMRQQCYDEQCRRAPRLPWQDLSGDNEACNALQVLFEAWPAARCAPDLNQWLANAPFARAK